MIDLRHIYSLSDFQRNARAHIERLRRVRRPEVLTVNGKAELVVQDAGSYQELLDRLEAGVAGGASSAVGRFEAAAIAGALEPDPVIEAYKKGVDRTLLRENLRKTVDERLRGLVELQRLAAEVRRAGRAASAGEAASAGGATDAGEATDAGRSGSRGDAG